MTECEWCEGSGIYEATRCWACDWLGESRPPPWKARAEEAEALLEQALTVGREMVTGWKARAEKYARAEGNAVEGEIAANVNAIDLKQQVDRLTEERDEWQARAEKAERECLEARAYYSDHAADAHMSRREAERQRDAALAKLDVASQYLSDIASGKQIVASEALAVIDATANTTKKEIEK